MNKSRSIPECWRCRLIAAAFWVAVGGMLGCTKVAPSPASLAMNLAPAKQYEVTIRRPIGTPRVDLGIADIDGNAVTAACSTCHTARSPNLRNRTADDLNEFHQGLRFTHDKASCLSCHNASNYDTLTLADGTAVAFADVMELCAQCHGTQTRDYMHGAHGGMTGHWDLSRGPRIRNNCVDCHDPHAPQFPKMQPTFKSHDRFLKGEDHGEPAP